MFEVLDKIDLAERALASGNLLAAERIHGEAAELLRRRGIHSPSQAASVRRKLNLLARLIVEMGGKP